MFISKRHPIAIPQWEHQKLAGTLALLWGNAAFERPPVPFESFLTGIGLHDHAYGMLDNLPIGGIPEEEWLALTRSGFEMTWADPVADLIAKMHLMRLASYGSAPARQALTTEMAQAIQAQIERHGLDATLFERIDRITDLCDRIAFDFCFEAASEGEVRIFPRNDRDEEVAVGYRVEDGTIRVDPWPFGVESHTGYLVGYLLAGYPAVLEPVIVPYRLVSPTLAGQQRLSDFFRTSPLAAHGADLTRDQSGLRRDDGPL
jgi:hypothetical protein